MIYRLSYRGDGCGGANHDFLSRESARRYAKNRRALACKIEGLVNGELVAIWMYQRPDCRHRLELTRKEVLPHAQGGSR